MQHDFVQLFADRYKVPLSDAQHFATAVAERCALVARRYEPQGLFTVEQMTVVETLGAEIGTAIIESFPPVE